MQAGQKSSFIAATRAYCIAVCGLVLLTGCGPVFSSPDAPASACKALSKTAFDAARKAGATSSAAKMLKNGVVSMSTGSGVVQCSSLRGSKQICKRPNDFVIHYTLADGRESYVMVPKNREYRLNINRRPTPCEVINQS